MSIATVISEGFVSGSIAAIIKDGFASYTGLPEPPAAGYQYETVGSLSYTGYSMQAGASPAVALGDVFILQEVTSPNSFVIEPNNNGTVEILAAGNTSRQSFLYERYRLSGGAIDGPATIWVNEAAPVWSRGINLTLPLSVAIAPIQLEPSYASSVSGDTLVFSTASGALPVGLSYAGTTIVGTVTNPGIYVFYINATDITGTSTTSPVSQLIVANPVPPPSGVPYVQGFTLNAAIAAYQMAGYNIILVYLVNSITVASGLIVAQNPAAGTSPATSTTQTLYQSIGPNTIQETNL
jgi:hypothetical protein